MENLVDRIVSECVKKQIVESEDADWFRYGLEKRGVLIFVGIPFFVLAIWMTDIWGALSFFISFFTLRSRINGYHANTPFQCFVASVALEYVLLRLLYPHLSNGGALIIMIASVVVIYLCAPYNHPNMQLTEKEVAVCRNSARMRSAILFLIAAISMLLGETQVAKGISLGSAMAAFLLCCAYIFSKRCNNGKNEDQSEQSAEWAC